MAYRIALISGDASPLVADAGIDGGGQNIYVAELTRSLVALGHRVDVFTRCDDPDLAATLDWLPGARVIHVPAGPKAFVRREQLLPTMQEFTSFVRRFCEHEGGYDVVHANFFLSGLVATELKRTLGVPFVMTFHGLGLVRRMHQGSADQFPTERIAVESRLVREADAIIAECPQDLRDMVTFYGASPSSVTVIPCGFEPTQFWPMDRRLARKTLGYEAREKLLLHVGGLAPRKGVDNVIRGLGHLNAWHDVPAKLLIIGGHSNVPDAASTPEIGRLRELAHSEGVADRVVFAGHRARELLKLYYSAADALVTTPWYEPFGIAPLEAMACGTPVVGSSVGGIQHSVVDNETGFLVPPKEPELLAQRLARLCTSPRLCRRLGRQAVRRVNRLFTWSTVTRAITTLYAAVQSGRRVPQATVATSPMADAA